MLLAFLPAVQIFWKGLRTGADPLLQRTSNRSKRSRAQRGGVGWVDIDRPSALTAVIGRPYARFVRLPILLFAGAIGLGACGGPVLPADRAGSSAFAPTLSGMSAGRYIKHVVIVVQENRSFDNIFAGFPAADSQMYGYLHTGTKVNLRPIPFQQKYIYHYYGNAVTDIDNGKMNGFDLNPSVSGTIGAYAYSYLERHLVKPYWTFAEQYVLADHMFPTMLGPSFTAHLTLIAGTADLNPALSEIDVPTALPWGCDAPTGTKTATLNSNRVYQAGAPYPPCFTQFNTMADTLDAAGVSWKYYAPKITLTGGATWSSFDAIKSVRYSSDWTTKVINQPTRILTDAARGRLAAVSWVIPDAIWSDHPDEGTPYGPSWVTTVVNAIGTSKQWSSTAIIVLWDDWGGFFDNAPPPQLDFRGLGIRVPCLIISPYVVPHVEHTQYEFGSILKFVEQTFGLATLGSEADGYTDGRATSILNSFDFTIAPRAYKRVPAPYPPSFFLNHAPSLRPPDTE
jgi:phospholipase C